MSSPAVSPSAATFAADPPRTGAAGKALTIGLIASVITWLGVFLPGGVQEVGAGWLVGFTYWMACAIGFLMLIMLLHIFDAMWGTVLRRQLEHGLNAFKVLAVVFVPLLIVSFIPGHTDAIWAWMNPHHVILPEHKQVGGDIIYYRKSGFLNLKTFVIFTAIFFALWIWMSARLKKASFAQDLDGDPRWTVKNRFTAGFGIPVSGLALTAASIYWIKSLEYHWFSTMFGVWYFADCMRGALSLGVLIMFWLWHRGDYKGVLNRNHWYSIGMLMLTFTIFWAYISFAQYFLIWNANVPEETFFFNEREFGGWYGVGMLLVFGHFLLPFLLLLSYRYKVTKVIIRRIAIWILFTMYADLCWYILPSFKDAVGNPHRLFGMSLLWSVTSMIGIGGICFWAYLRAVPTTKLIPIRDPRITESLTHHDDE